MENFNRCKKNISIDDSIDKETFSFEVITTILKNGIHILALKLLGILSFFPFPMLISFYALWAAFDWKKIKNNQPEYIQKKNAKLYFQDLQYRLQKENIYASSFQITNALPIDFFMVEQGKILTQEKLFAFLDYENDIVLLKEIKENAETILEIYNKEDQNEVLYPVNDQKLKEKLLEKEYQR